MHNCYLNETFVKSCKIFWYYLIQVHFLASLQYISDYLQKFSQFTTKRYKKYINTYWNNDYVVLYINKGKAGFSVLSTLINEINPRVVAFFFFFLISLRLSSLLYYIRISALESGIFPENTKRKYLQEKMSRSRYIKLRSIEKNRQIL